MLLLWPVLGSSGTRCRQPICGCMIHSQHRRARATIVFFIPRRLAICIAQALSQDHFSSTAACSELLRMSMTRIISSPQRDILPFRSTLARFDTWRTSAQTRPRLPWIFGSRAGTSTVAAIGERHNGDRHRGWSSRRRPHHHHPDNGQQTAMQDDDLVRVAHRRTMSISARPAPLGRGRFSTSSLMRASNFTFPTMPTLRPKLRKVPSAGPILDWRSAFDCS